jgi:DNA-binding Lrp family transcriptional regulator
MDKKEALIISSLRENARESLTKISKRTSIPISTLFEKIKVYEEDYIDRHTSLLNFTKLGFNTRVAIMIKVSNEQREMLKEHLNLSKCVNSVFKINNNYDFIVEGIFHDIKEVDEFIERLEKTFKILDKEVYHIVEDVKREDFMSSPEYVKLSMES